MDLGFQPACYVHKHTLRYTSEYASWVHVVYSVMQSPREATRGVVSSRYDGELVWDAHCSEYKTPLAFLTRTTPSDAVTSHIALQGCIQDACRMPCLGNYIQTRHALNATPTSNPRGSTLTPDPLVLSVSTPGGSVALYPLHTALRSPGPHVPFIPLRDQGLYPEEPPLRFEGSCVPGTFPAGSGSLGSEVGAPARD